MRFWKSAVLVTALGVAAVSTVGSAAADIVVTVNKATQRMSVSVDGSRSTTGSVSTGVYGTPSGAFRRKRCRATTGRASSTTPRCRMRSSTTATTPSTAPLRSAGLAGRASKGCVRLHPSNAAVLFALVQKEGTGNTRIYNPVSCAPAAQADRRAARRLRVAAALRAERERAAAGRCADARPPSRPPFRDEAWLTFLPRPEPLFLPPPVSLLTVAQARRSASFCGRHVSRSPPRCARPGVSACWCSSICRLGALPRPPDPCRCELRRNVGPLEKFRKARGTEP